MSRALRLALLLLAAIQVIGCTNEEACHLALNRFWNFEIWPIDPETDEQLTARHDHARRLLQECEDRTPWFDYEGSVGAPEGKFSISVLAIYLDDTELLDSLVSSGHPIDGLPNPYADTSIHMAVAMRSDSVLGWLIERNVDVNLANDDGTSPLVTAAGREGAHTYVIPLLISAGAEVNGSNHFGQTALYRAIFYKQPENAQLLIDSGADVDVVRTRLEDDLQRAYRGRQRDVALERLELLHVLVGGSQG